MTLATDKDSQVDPSPFPLPGSPHSQLQNSTSSNNGVDETETGPENIVEIVEKHPTSLTTQQSGGWELGALGQIESVTESRNYSQGNGASATAGSSQLNGNSASDHTGMRASPALSTSTVSSTESLSHQQGAHRSPEDTLTQPTHQGKSDGQADTLSGESSPLVQSSVKSLPFPEASTTPVTIPSAPSVPMTSRAFTDSHAKTSSDNDDMMVDNDRSPSSDSRTPEEMEPLAKRTRSRQKRSPDAMSHEPAKRARTSSDVSLGTTASLVSEGNLTGGESEDRTSDVEMRVSPRAHATVAGSNTAAARYRDMQVLSVVDPACNSPRADPQSTSAAIAVSTTSDSNLDPSLVHPPNVTRPSAGSPRASPNNPSEPSTQDKTSKTSSSPSRQAKSSTSSLANNPYLALSTAFLKGSSNSTGYNPYALYYGPGTPITPHTPTYPYPYLYHLHSPLSAQAMYPTSPSFTSSPAAQKSPPPPTPSTSEPQRQKPKRLKAHTVTSGNHNIPIVPRDKKGKPMLPLNVGIMTVIRLGEVCMREHFHTERYIFPVGYEVTRRYLSTMDPNTEVVYHCTILDGGDGPKFQIVPSDAPDRTVIAGTATGAWSNIVKQANAIRSRQHSNSVSGPDFFGLGQNTIKHLIQELPNADRLRDYVWQNFIEGGPLGGRHAAVTPALPEDYDSTLPIGALYPVERDRLKREAIASPRGLNYYPQHIIAQAEAQRKDQGGGQQIGQPANATILNQQHPSAPDSALPLLDTRVAGTNGHVSGPIISSGLPHNSVPTASSTVPSQPSPVLQTDAPANSQQSPSSVPATIASIMSAYPAPPTTSTPVSVTPTSAPAPASPLPS